MQAWSLDGAQFKHASKLNANNRLLVPELRAAAVSPLVVRSDQSLGGGLPLGTLATNWHVVGCGRAYFRIRMYSGRSVDGSVVIAFSQFRHSSPRLVNQSAVSVRSREFTASLSGIQYFS